MAGALEQPFGLNFLVDAVHSGSISFGRFENEDLCWEKRSSFLHNRYLEEVEKCSKPGSVTEKKAYFEAHFRKKGFPGLNEYHSSENDASEKMDSVNKDDRVNNSEQFDEGEDFVISFSEPQNELESDTANNKDIIEKAVEADGVDLGSLLLANSNSGTKMNGNLDGETADLDDSRISSMAVDLFPDAPTNEENTNPCPREHKDSSPEEKESLEAESAVSRLIPQVQSGQRRRYASEIAFKATEKKSPKPAPVRGSKTEGISELKREPTNIIIEKPHSSVPKKFSNRAHQSVARIGQAVGANNPGIKQNNSKYIFKSDGNVQKKKKLEGRTRAWEAKVQKLQNIDQEKKNAEIKQFRKSLNFKAIPMPSFYRANGDKTSDGKYSIRRHRASQSSKEESVLRRIIDRPQASVSRATSFGGGGRRNRDAQLQKPTSLRIERNSNTSTRTRS